MNRPGMNALTIAAFALAATSPMPDLSNIDLRDRSRPRRSVSPDERAERKRKAKAAKASRKRNR